MAGAPRLVLDTNAWLDLLVFADPATRPLLEAAGDGSVEILIDPPTRVELVRVLGYPVLSLDAAARERIASRADGLSRMHEASEPRALPRCRDPDDQKFLSLAAAGDAAWLLTRDDALLRLAARFERETGCRIMSPVEWASVWTARATDP
jgi:putative PIN family toxin of toxin-antitoxin system